MPAAVRLVDNPERCAYSYRSEDRLCGEPSAYVVYWHPDNCSAETVARAPMCAEHTARVRSLSGSAIVRVESYDPALHH